MDKILVIFILTIFSLALGAQSEKRFVRKGNSQYTDKKYAEAEVNYRKALEQKGNFGQASYNLGNSLYRQNKYEDAAQEYTRASDAGMSKKDAAKAYHNLGNSYLQAQKFQESVDAYKKALKQNPFDLETKYNLALAQKMLKNPPKQENKQNQQNQDQKKDEQDKKDQQNKQDKQDQQKDQQQQQQQGKLSKEDAKRMLQAIQDDENNTQEKLKKEKAMGQKSRPDVDW